MRISPPGSCAPLMTSQWPSRASVRSAAWAANESAARAQAKRSRFMGELHYTRSRGVLRAVKLERGLVRGFVNRRLLQRDDRADQSAVLAARAHLHGHAAERESARGRCEIMQRKKPRAQTRRVAEG